jgi:hypothetical protein
MGGACEQVGFANRADASARAEWLETPAPPALCGWGAVLTLQR